MSPSFDVNQFAQVMATTMLAARPPTPPVAFHSTTVVSDAKQLFTSHVAQIKGVYAPGKFQMLFKPLEVQPDGVVSSYNMDFTREAVRRALRAEGIHGIRRDYSTEFLDALALQRWDTGRTGLSLDKFGDGTPLTSWNRVGLAFLHYSHINFTFS